MTDLTTQDPGHGPEAQSPLPLAAYHLRLFAILIDYLLAVTMIKLGEQVLLGSDWDLRAAPASGQAGTVAWVLMLFVLIVLKDSYRGQSLGKWITGIVIRATPELEAPPPLWRLWLRNATLLVLPIDGALMFIDPFSRRIGDRLARTVVVARSDALPLPRRLLLLTAFFMVLLLASLLVTPWNMRRSAAYKTAIAVARQHPQVVNVAGDRPAFGGAPEMELHLTEAGGDARVILTTEGRRSEWRITVDLDLDREARRWRLDTLRVAPAGERPDLEQQQAPAR